MATSGFSDLGCGKYSYNIKDSTAKITCRNPDNDVAAPRGDKESEGAVSLDSAIEQFCTDNNAKDVNKGENVYQRYAITNWGVSNRNSFWLRGAITCGEKETMSKDDCIKALKDGIDQCNAGSGYSYGLAASVGCLDYSIDVSGLVQDNSPPWDEKISFPPPRSLARENWRENPVNWFGTSTEAHRVIKMDDVNTFIGEWCQSDGPWKNDIWDFELKGKLAAVATPNCGIKYADQNWCK